MRRLMLSLLVASKMMVLVSMSFVLEAAAESTAASQLRVLAVETFLADIARNVAGERTGVGALLPVGADPHAFEPTPADVARVAESNVLIVHGAGLETFLDQILRNAGGTRRIIDVSAGLKPRSPKTGEAAKSHEKHDHAKSGPHRHADRRDHKGIEHHDHHHHGGDPHFWLSPIHVIHYVEMIRDGLSQEDPAGAEAYAANAEAYICLLYTSPSPRDS